MGPPRVIENDLSNIYFYFSYMTKLIFGTSPPPTTKDDFCHPRLTKNDLHRPQGTKDYPNCFLLYFFERPKIIYIVGVKRVKHVQLT